MPLKTKVDEMRGSRRGLTSYSTYVFLGFSRSPDGAIVNILPIEFFIKACSFVRFHTFIIVNYVDIGRKMNYNRNLQFGECEI